MKPAFKKIRFTAAALLLASILIDPQSAVDAARQAMYSWYTSVAPSLFPFLALMPLITDAEACRMYNRLFGWMMQPLFRLPGCAAPAVVIGMLCGSPGAAIGVCRVAGESGMKRADARRLALVLGGISPAYLVVGVGMLLLGSPKLGFRLALVQALTQLILLFLLSRIYVAGDSEPAPRQDAAAQRPVRAAVEAVLGVAGYMIVFAIAGSMLSRLAGKQAGAVLHALLDLPSGLPGLLNLDNFWKLPVLCATIGFSGACIIAQNLDALRTIGVGVGEYIAMRGISALLSCCLGIFLIGGCDTFSASISRNMPGVYGIYLLLVLLFSIYPLGILSKNIFLNNSKKDKKPA